VISSFITSHICYILSYKLEPTIATAEYMKQRVTTNAVLSTGGADTVGLAGDAVTCLLANSNWFCSR